MLPPSPCVLVVDADPDLRSLYVALCQGAVPGVKVDVAEDGLRARELVMSGRYSLMICGLLLPRLDGISLLREIQERALVAAMVVTSLDAPRVAPARALSNVVEVLHKPVTAERMIAGVRRVLTDERYRLAG